MKLLILSVCVVVAAAEAAPVYQLGSDRYFGSAAGRTNGYVSTPLAGNTADQLPVNYDDGNTYDGHSAIQGSPVVMETSTSVNITSAVVTDNVVGYLARNRVILFDNVTVLGGSGVAYISPVLHITGTFTDNSADLFSRFVICFGVGSCVFPPPPGNVSAGGTQNVDITFTPPVTFFPSAFDFTFGTPFSTFMFVDTSVSAIFGQGVTVPAGTSLSADFRFELLGYRVFDVDGNEIADVTVQSEALALPEPGSALLGALGLTLLAGYMRKRR